METHKHLMYLFISGFVVVASEESQKLLYFNLFTSFFVFARFNTEEMISSPLSSSSLTE